eukprot:s370_g5.t1
MQSFLQRPSFSQCPIELGRYWSKAPWGLAELEVKSVDQTVFWFKIVSRIAMECLLQLQTRHAAGNRLDWNHCGLSPFSDGEHPSLEKGVEPPPPPPPPRGTEPTEADLLCADFLVQVRLHTREGYEEALRLGEEILRLEPGNRLVLEYQEVIRGFLHTFGEYVEQVQAREADPNRTPSEVSTEESEVAEKSEDESQQDVVSEVPTDPAISPREIE